jgi:NADH-quinone oxidoreductase subunit J
MTGQLLAAGPSFAASISEEVVFWILAVVAVCAGLGMIMARKAVHCAILLAVVMLSLAILYATQGAPFLAFVQVIVYTGAVLMLFLFVVMLVGVASSESVIETIRGQRLAAGLAGIGLVILLLAGVGHTTLGGARQFTGSQGAAFGSGNLTEIARLLFTRYVFAFEVTSALLITAALGAMVLAHRERTAPKPTQEQLAKQRVRSGYPTPLPAPGTYARHNAVDRPALLPDGRASQLSVSPVIAGRRGSGSADDAIPREALPPAENQPAGQHAPENQGEPS